MYGVVRHPVYLSVLVMMWATPAMSLTYLGLALNVTLCFYIGSYLEERRLVSRFGQEYGRYQEQVSRLFPWRWLLALPREDTLRKAERSSFCGAGWRGSSSASCPEPTNWHPFARRFPS